MTKWPNLDKIMANRDFIILHNEEIQGQVLIKDLPKVIEQYNLDKLQILSYEVERNLITRIYMTTFYNNGTKEVKTLFQHKNEQLIDDIDPLNTYGRIIVNNKIREKINEHNN